MPRSDCVNPRAIPASASPGRPWLALAAGLLVTILAYAGSFRAPLVFDDLPAIADNASIRELGNLAAVLSPRADSGLGGRPVANLTFALTHRLGGGEVWAHHLGNLGIHLLAALVLFLVLWRTLRPLVQVEPREEEAGFLAAAIATLWAIHPLQTQTVTYLSQRTEALMALCFLLVLYGARRASEVGGWRWPAMAVAACLLGTLCKEVIVTAPLLVLLYDRTFLAGSFHGALRARWRLHAALALAWPVLAWVLLGVGERGVGFGLGVTPWQYALTQCRSILLYVQLAVWPYPLVFDRGVGVVQAWTEVWPQALALAGLLAGTVWLVVRRPVAGFAAAWFFVILAPASSVVPVIGAPTAENRPYLPLAAVVAAGLVSLHRWLGRGVWRIVAAGLVMAAAVATARRNADYGSAVRLWEDTVRNAPDNARAHNTLAMLLAATPGREAEALPHLEEALRLKPDYAEAHANLALLLGRRPERREDAIRHYETALRLAADPALVHNNLANLLARDPARQAEARTHYEAALRLRPGHAGFQANFAGFLAARPESIGEAIAHYEIALRLNPADAEVHCDLALLLAGQAERRSDARAHFETALRLQPALARAHVGLGNLLGAEPGGEPAAVAHFEAALQSAPDLPEAHFGLAVQRARDPARRGEAIRHYETALRGRPEFFEAHSNLAGLLAELPDRQAEALAHYEAALRLRPNIPALHFNLARHLARFPGRRREVEAHLAAAVELDPQFTAARDALRRLRELPP